MGAKAGTKKVGHWPPQETRQLHRAPNPEIPPTRSDRRSPPLFSTYAQPKPPDAFYDETKARRVVDFVQRLYQFEGRLAGDKIRLLRWQERLLREAWMNRTTSKEPRSLRVRVRVNRPGSSPSSLVAGRWSPRPPRMSSLSQTSTSSTTPCRHATKQRHLARERTALRAHQTVRFG